MSRAFVKETDDGAEELPEKLISAHRNLVTAAGLAIIDAEVAKAQTALAQAQTDNDRAGIARASRDLRYWAQRQSSAELQAGPQPGAGVQFGSRVTLDRDGGRRVTYAIVGEDEANPASGTISYVSPLAQALLGRAVGEEVRAGAMVGEIIAID